MAKKFKPFGGKESPAEEKAEAKPGKPFKEGGKVFSQETMKAQGRGMAKAAMYSGGGAVRGGGAAVKGVGRGEVF